MPSYAELPLWRDFAPGCLLPVAQRPRASGLVTLPDGAEVEIRKGAQAVSVRKLPDLDREGLLSHGIERANIALDLFAGTGVAAVNLGDVEAFHGTWLREGKDTVLRVSLSYHLQVRAMVGGFFQEPDGNLVLSPPYGEWNRALRYFRLSQASDDLFDAFRNLYLALECLLNKATPRDNGEREGAWLKRSLRDAYDGHGFATILADLDPGGSDSLYEAIWKSARNPVFHAKEDDSSFLPLDVASRETVRVNVLRCARLCSALLAELYGVRFLSSGIASASGKAACESVLAGAEIALTDDSSPLEMEHGAVSPGGHAVMLFEAHPVSVHGTRFDACIRGRTRADEVVQKVGLVRRIAAATAESAGIAEVLDGALDVAGSDALEVEWALSCGGVAPKSAYSS